MDNTQLSRRRFVWLGATAAASVVLGATGCGSQSGGAGQAQTDSASESAPSSDLDAQTAHEQTAESEQATSNAQGSSAGAEGQFAIADKQLASGFAIPAFGIGTWTLSPDEAEASCYTALQNGYRLIDTAQYYGNEDGVGRAVRRGIADGLCSRESVFVTSKIMPSSFDRAAESIDESLARLDIDYLDLMLIHQPGSNDDVVWRALEDAVSAGKVRSIGISNYYTPEAYDAIANIAQVPVALVQNENHPYYQNTSLQSHVQATGGFVESWYPLGGRPGVAQMLADETLNAIAVAHGKTAAQVCLRWQVQAGYIAIPGSSNPDHIAENIQIFDFALSESEMSQIAALNGAGRFENW